MHKAIKSNLSGPLSTVEFAAIGAFMVALVAMSINIVMPAMNVIGNELGAPSANAAQNIITALFFGLALGQILFGPISDSTGRKPAIYFGVALFFIGCIISYLAESFEMMLVGRFLQGFGAAGPRIVIMAVIRDLYAGREMARIASIMMGFFILVPMLAPSLGQALMLIMPWRMIFIFMLVFAVAVVAWYGIRQRETLAADNRRAFSVDVIGSGIKEVLCTRVSLGYTLAAGFIFGAFNTYLISSQQIFADVFGVREAFPIYFGVLSLPIAASGILNSVFVVRIGMRRMCQYALLSISLVSGGFFIAASMNGGVLPLPIFLTWAVIAFFSIGVLFGNFNAIAMEPLGHIAGIGAAIIGSLSTLMSALLGWGIGAIYNETLLPLIGAFAALGLLSILIMLWTDRYIEPRA